MSETRPLDHDAVSLFTDEKGPVVGEGIWDFS